METMTMDPNDQLVAATLAKFHADALANAQRGLDAAAALLRVQIVQQLSTHGTGRLYARRRQTRDVYSGPLVARQGPVPVSANALGSVGSIKRRKNIAYTGEQVAILGPARKGGRYGKVGVHRKANFFHQASVAGASPAPDVGALRQSVYAETENANTRTIGVAKEYARALEEGAGRVAARPFMAPALATFKALIGDSLQFFKVTE
jgi:hypothetical protein